MAEVEAKANVSAHGGLVAMRRREGQREIFEPGDGFSHGLEQAPGLGLEGEHDVDPASCMKLVEGQRCPEDVLDVVAARRRVTTLAAKAQWHRTHDCTLATCGSNEVSANLSSAQTVAQAFEARPVWLVDTLLDGLTMEATLWKNVDGGRHEAKF